MRTLIEIGDRTVRGFAIGDFPETSLHFADGRTKRISGSFIAGGVLYQVIEGRYEVGPGACINIELRLPPGHPVLCEDPVGERLRLKRIHEETDQQLLLWDGTVRESLANDSGRLRLVCDAEAA